MVPVPEELEQSVLERVLVLTMTSRGAATWSPERLRQHLDALAPDARNLTRSVAARIVAGHSCEDVELAAEFGLSVRELLGLAQEVNDVTIDPFPGVILSVQCERVDADDPSIRRDLHLNPLVAAAVCDLPERSSS
jgi:hypothetical protein